MRPSEFPPPSSSEARYVYAASSDLVVEALNILAVDRSPSREELERLRALVHNVSYLLHKARRVTETSPSSKR